MIDKALLSPAAVLVAWSLLMLLWMVITRLPAMRSSGIDLAKAPPGGRGADLEKVLPANVNWKSHNYTHLMEQPTLFYAVIVILTLVGATGRTNVALAWSYVGLRIVHSFWQATVNTIPVRLTLFALSTACLIGLAANAVLATLL